MDDTDSSAWVREERSRQHPVLKGWDTSYPGGRYFAEVRTNPDGLSIEVSHHLKNAQLICRLIDSGLAVYACAVESSNSAHLSMHTSSDPRQLVALDRAELGGRINVTPCILLAEPCTVDLEPMLHGVHPEWRGRQVEMEKGTRLAEDGRRRLQKTFTDIVSLFDVEQFEEKSVNTKEYNINIMCYSDPISCFVGLRQKYREELRHADVQTQSLTMTKFAFACLDRLASEKIEEGDGHGWVQINSSDKFTDNFASNGLGHWTDWDFSPEKAAWALYPVPRPDRTGGSIPAGAKVLRTLMRKRKELHELFYKDFSGHLIRSRGKKRQRNFLEDVLNNQRFLHTISTLGETGLVDIEIAPFRITESEYRDPPASMAKRLYEKWGALDPATACRSTFWAYATYMHIAAGRIHSTFLASNPGDAMSGAERIEAVLSDQSKDQRKRIEDCANTVLRRLGGLQEIPGSDPVHVDCPFARAWWREHMARQAAGGNAQVEASIRSLLHLSPAYWSVMAYNVVNGYFGSGSTLASSKVRNAFLRALAHFVSNNRSTEFATPDGLRQLIGRVSECDEARELCFLEASELDDIMDGIVNGV